MASVSIKNSERVAFFNITDVHAYYKLANRIDYAEEIKAIIQRVGKIVSSYRRRGYYCISIINGDLAHKGSKVDENNDITTQLIKLLLSYFHDNYINFGNHEFTYYKNNPVLKFIKEIEDLRILEKYPHIKAKSTVPTLKCVPRITLDDFEIIFTPYKMLPAQKEKEISILIMHDDIVSNYGFSRVRTLIPGYEMTRTMFAHNVYQYVFCGHVHLTHEKWMHGITQVYNLASLGRTSVREVIDDYRTRTIPVIISENGKFKEVVDELITLHKREDVVDEEKVIISQKQYQMTKERLKRRESLSINRGTPPIQALEDDLNLVEDKELLNVFNMLKDGKAVRYFDFKERMSEND